MNDPVDSVPPLDTAGNIRPTSDRHFFYPNKMGRIVLLAMEEVMGRNGVNAILNLARLKNLVNCYPPNNFDRQFTFEEVGAIQQALDDMYGPRGSRGLALRAGRARPHLCWHRVPRRCTHISLKPVSDRCTTASLISR